eukprot:scaffold4698_cov115-Isochrysis_galbana.AAC.9
MGSATWSQIPSHAGWGEGGGDDGRGDEESIRTGTVGQHCKVAEYGYRYGGIIQQLGVESLWRGYERPAVQGSRARLRPMLVAPIRSRLKRCPSCPQPQGP